MLTVHTNHYMFVLLVWDPIKLKEHKKYYMHSKFELSVFWQLFLVTQFYRLQQYRLYPNIKNAMINNTPTIVTGIKSMNNIPAATQNNIKPINSRWSLLIFQHSPFRIFQSYFIPITEWVELALAGFFF